MFHHSDKEYSHIHQCLQTKYKGYSFTVEAYEMEGCHKNEQLNKTVQNIGLPVSQLIPVYPSTHSQVKLLTSSSHVPPFWQG